MIKQIENYETSLNPWAVYCEGPPSFIWRGGVRGCRWAKNEALLFQSTVDIHFQNAHKTAKASTLCVYLNTVHVCVWRTSGVTWNN